MIIALDISVIADVRQLIRILILIIRTPRAPLFSGKNIINFLDAFNDLCDEHIVEEKDRLTKIY